MPANQPNPEDAQIVLEVGAGDGKGAGLRIDTWRNYAFNSHFLTPTDGWSFTLGDETISDELRAAIAPRQRVTLRINGLPQSLGYIDKVASHSSRGQGMELTVEGRDLLSPAIDACMDPRTRFTAKMTLLDLVKVVFGPFGWTEEFNFSVDNEANRNLATGQTRGTPTSKKGKPLKSYEMHQLKPCVHEGAFAFAARVAQRFGLWIWLSVDNAVVVGKPAFDEQPLYRAVHKRGPAGAANNVLSASSTLDATAQPSVIYASGFGTGGENPRDQFSLGVLNPVIVTDNSASFAAYPKTRMIETNYFGPTITDPYARPLFLHDDESKTADELERFLRRELALRMHKSLQYNFEVEGHEYLSEDGSRIPWMVDALVNVNDDICGVHEVLWILSRTFTKDRNGGTRTRIECIRPHSLEF